MSFAWRSRFALSVTPATATVWGLRQYRRLKDSLTWLYKTREAVSLDCVAAQAIGGNGEFGVSAGQVTVVPFNHVRWDAWNMAQASSTSPVNFIIDRAARMHANGWWLFAVQAKFLTPTGAARLFVEIVFKVNQVEYIMGRYECGRVDVASVDTKLHTSFVFNLARFQEQLPIEVTARVYSSLGNITVQDTRLWGIALVLHPTYNGLTAGATGGAYALATRWTSGALVAATHIATLVTAVNALCANRVIIDFEKNNAQSIPYATVTALTWTSAFYDPWNYNPGGTWTQWPWLDGPAIIMIMACLPISPTDGTAQQTRFLVGIQRNGADIMREDTNVWNWPGGQALWVGTICKANTNDVFKINVYHEWKNAAGAGIATTMGAVFLGYQAVPRFSIVTLKPTAVALGTVSWSDPDELTVNSPYTFAIHNKLADDATWIARERPGARVFYNNVQNLINAAWVALTYNTAEFNDYAIWSAGAPTIITVPAGCGGIWLVSGVVFFSTGAACIHGVRIVINSAVEVERYQTSGGGPTLSIPPTPVKVAAGDTIKMEAYQNSGVTVTVGFAGDTSGWSTQLVAQMETTGA